MLMLKHNPQEATGRNKAHKLIGTGKQTDYSGYDLQGGNTLTNVINHRAVYQRHQHSTQTEAQQIRIIAKVRRIAKELDRKGIAPERVKKLNDLLDGYVARLKQLQAIVEKRSITP